MLRKIRVTLAVLFWLAVTLLFLDFTGVAHAWLGWTAKIQFLPAVLALNVGVVIGLVALTLVFGRVYCSVICPLGVMQDFFGWMGKKSKKNRYTYSPAKNILRYSVLALFVVALVAGVGSFVALLAPYSSYGRIAQNLLAPLWDWGNNLLAYFAERSDSYAFYTVDVWLRSVATLCVAVATLVVLAVLAWRNGRTYCNTICPVGTILGFLSRFALLRPVIDTSKCVNCGLCARNCKASCINMAEHTVDMSRCVACMDCLEKCHTHAISYTWRRSPVKASLEGTKPAGPQAKSGADDSRRRFLGATIAVATASAISAQDKIVDGGLAPVLEKKKPVSRARIVPPGAQSLKNFYQHCTACQLCVAACPNKVLRPTGSLMTLMQPESSYERGYCRPECNICSQVCPSGAIKPISVEEKSSIQIGHAVWVKSNCIPLTDGVECGNCARHCPSGAIQMVPSDADNPESVKIPVVNTARCIGCGACENLCPARPFSAIYVEGNEQHKTI